jgi:hypothetical protein
LGVTLRPSAAMTGWTDTRGCDLLPDVTFEAIALALVMVAIGFGVVVATRRIRIAER